MPQSPKLESRKLAAIDGVRHGFFTRQGGVSDGIYASLNGGVGSSDAAEKVAENRARMAKALDVAPERFLTAYQIHSPDVVVVGEPWTHETRPRADAIVTATPGIAIGVSTADCGPVLFADREKRVIGAAHAGWRGAFAGVLEATIAAMEKLGAARERLTVALGPMIRQASYEVGPEFVTRFVAAEPEYTRFFKHAGADGHAMFDLAGFIAWRLQHAGVGDIDDLGLDTFADPDRFYSYRRTTKRAEPDYGRHINAIALDR
jgi:YfiH family protein